MLLDLDCRDGFVLGKKKVPDVGPMVQAAARPVIVAPASSFRTGPKLPQTAASLASGPLPIGARESGVGPLPTKQPLQAPARAQPPLRTSSGLPFAGVQSYIVVRNPTTSMDSSPVGLVGTGPLHLSHFRRRSRPAILHRWALPVLLANPAIKVISYMELAGGGRCPHSSTNGNGWTRTVLVLHR